MRCRRSLLVIACWAGLLGSVAAGEVVVDFVHPERYADIGPGHTARQRNLTTLREHVQAWGPRLPPGQTLKLEFIDIDLAGTALPWGHWPEVRVLRGSVDGPRMAMNWSLTSGPRTLASGHTVLSDLDVLRRLPLRPVDSPLGHERRLLDDWLRETLPATVPTPAPTLAPTPTQ